MGRMRFGLLLLLACDEGGDSALQDSASAGIAGEFLASDLHGNQWFIADADGATKATYTLDLADPICRGVEYQPYCLLFQSKRRVALDGADEVMFTWSQLDSSDGSDQERGDLDGFYAAVDAETFAERWRIDTLDFSAYSGLSGCPYDPADPCALQDSWTDAEYQMCRLHMPHDLEVVSQSDSELRLWLADTGNNRMLDVSLAPGSTCAVVNDVIDDQNPDWDIYSSNNSVNYRVEEDGTETLLMSAKGSREWTAAGAAQLAGSGKGKILLWENAGDGWHQRWEFPEQLDGVESFVSNPHGSQFITDSSGNQLVAYAHSLGLHDEWTANTGVGSVGVLVLGDDKLPSYVADIRVSGGGALHFPRDITVVDEAHWLVTDSGCVGGICTRESQALVIAPIEGEPSDKSGTFTTDHINLNVVDAKVLSGPYFTASDQLYSVEWTAD